MAGDIAVAVSLAGLPFQVGELDFKLLNDVVNPLKVGFSGI